jgi:dTMP kinase
VGDFAPDLTLILDIPVEAGLDRTQGRTGGEDRYERMDREFHRWLRDGFLDIAAREPGRCVVIDAARPVEAVQADMLATVLRHFPEAAAS